MTEIEPSSKLTRKQAFFCRQTDLVAQRECYRRALGAHKAAKCTVIRVLELQDTPR